MPKKVKPGVNDLKTLYPDIAADWDYEKNGSLTPDMVMPGSSIRVWWKCSNKSCNHSWYIPVGDRVRSKGCPKCIAKKAAPGKDLMSVDPLLCEEWDYELNGDLTPDMVSYGSKEKVYWKCKTCGNSWKAAIYNRAGSHKSGCPECRKEKQTSFPEQTILYYIKQANLGGISRFTSKWFAKEQKNSTPELDIYIPTLAVGIEYDGQRFHNDAERDCKKIELCQRYGVTLFRIRESECPSISKEAFVKSVKARNESDLESAIRWIIDSINSLFSLTLSIDVNIERDRQAIYSQMSLVKKENSLAEVNPSLAEEWDYEMNKDLTPDMFLPKSGKHVWWKCPDCGDSYKAKVCSRSYGHAHSTCSHRKGSQLYWNTKKSSAENPIAM